MLRIYWVASGLLVLGYAFVWLMVHARVRAPFSARLKLAQAVLAAALLLPLAIELVPMDPLARPSVQVWSGKPGDGRFEAFRVVRGQGAPLAAARIEGLKIDERIPRAIGAVIAFAVLCALILHLGRLRRLGGALRATTEIRRIGRVSVRISVEGAAYSAWMPDLRGPRALRGFSLGTAHVVLPAHLLEHRADLGLALKHELQHHRQRDTLWVHLIEFCRALFFWNPAARGWAQVMEELQELACDEALVGRRAISPQAYGSCLMRAAQLALGSRPVTLAGTAGMATGRSGRQLKRRVEMLFDKKDRRLSRGSKVVAVVLVSGTLVLMGGTALAARGLVKDRALTMEEARKLVASLPQGAIQVDLNERVLERLNRMVGTPEGRARIKEGLARMPLYRAMIERKLEAAGYPLDLLAVPLVESGYSNAVISPEPYRARGIWQFIEPTAINYGLRVDSKVDERLDPEKETDAAVAYYKDLLRQFGDWRLAIKAYNEGESKVQRLIDRHKTRDPWVLESLEPSYDYLPQVIAGILVLRHPALLE
jgi:membrane-bound lytic murein transglycosylase D